MNAQLCTTTTITRGDVQVVLSSDAETLVEVKRLALPYFTFSSASSEAPKSWHIYAGTEHGPAIGADYVRHCGSTEFEPERCCFINAQRREIILDEPDSQWRSMNALRMVRNLLLWQLYERDALFLHGGLVEYEQSGLAILGAKKSGKTSALLSVLTQSNIKFVTNDDICVPTTEAPPRGLGWPRSIGVRRDTLPWFEDLAPELVQASMSVQHPANQGENRIANDRIYFSPAELTSLMGTNVRTECKIQAIIFPTFTNHGTEPSLIRMTQEEGEAHLLPNILRVPDDHNEFLTNLFYRDRFNTERHAVKTLLAEVECYRLNQSSASLKESAGLLAKLLRRLSGYDNTGRSSTWN